MGGCFFGATIFGLDVDKDAAVGFPRDGFGLIGCDLDAPVFDSEARVFRPSFVRGNDGTGFRWG